jgi:hypothetical protein
MHTQTEMATMGTSYVSAPQDSGSHIFHMSFEMYINSSGKYKIILKMCKKKLVL